MSDEQIGKHVNHFDGGNPSANPYGQTLTAELVQHVEHSKSLRAIGSVMLEISPVDSLDDSL